MRSTTRKRIEACKRVSAPPDGDLVIKYQREFYSAHALVKQENLQNAALSLWPYNPVPIEEPPKRSIWCGLIGR